MHILCCDVLIMDALMSQNMVCRPHFTESQNICCDLYTVTYGRSLKIQNHSVKAALYRILLPVYCNCLSEILAAPSLLSILDVACMASICKVSFCHLHL